MVGTDSLLDRKREKQKLKNKKAAELTGRTEAGIVVQLVDATAAIYT